MHVGVFTLRDMSLAGGGFLRIVGPTRYLSELGCQATLFAPAFTPKLEGKVSFVLTGTGTGTIDQASRLPLLYTAFPMLLNGLRHTPDNLDLAALINEQGIDLIHCQAHGAGFRLLEILSLLTIPIALDLHGILKLQLQPLGKIARRKNILKALKSFLKARWNRYLVLRSERSLFRLMDALIVRTEAEREYVAENFHIAAERIYVIPDGVDVDFLSELVSEVDQHALRAELGLQGKKVILWGGGFKADGGMMDLVQAFQILNSQRSDVALVLIGDVNYLTIQVENFIREQRLSDVTLLGRQSRERYRVFQQTANVMITPEIKTTYNELAVPLKLLDCLGSSRPTVATRIRSHTSIIQDGVNGFLVEPQDLADIARGITRALDDPNAAEIGLRGRQTVIENHSWRRSAQYAVNAYADILQRRVHNRGSR